MAHPHIPFSAPDALRQTLLPPCVDRQPRPGDREVYHKPAPTPEVGRPRNGGQRI